MTGKKMKNEGYYPTMQNAAVRDANAFSSMKDGRTIGWHVHVVWANYQDAFPDFWDFCLAIMHLSKPESEARKYAVAQLRQRHDTQTSGV